MTVLTTSLTDELAEELKSETELVAVDELTIVRKALSDYLRRLHIDRLRNELRPYAEAAGFFTEDIFKEIS